MIKTRSQSGFSLIEVLVATAVLLIVSSIVTTALMQMTQSQMTIWNRTEMHSGIRGATELLQQEIGQAGRVSLAATPELTATPAAVASCDPGDPALGAVDVGIQFRDSTGTVVTSVGGINPITGIFASAGPPAAYVLLTTMDGDNQETIRIASVNVGASTIRACFSKAHSAGTKLAPLGVFATGVIPPTGILNPSTANRLKLYGDINGDGHMVYVEYYCDNGDPGTDGSFNLYRNVMPYDTAAASKPPITNSMILLSNVHPNPPDASGPRPCFQYQTTSLLVQGTTFTFVLDVAVTLTVETQQLDPVTRQKQTETKALLNVSPRNVFNAWALASIGYTDRIQSTPASVTSLLP